MASSILLVEDDLYLSQGLTELLQKSGYVPCQAWNLSQARQSVYSRNFDLLILDVTLPDGDGISFCRELRARGCATPILFLTAKTEEADVIQGLGLGGDDYLTKPFRLGELRARVAAHLRRQHRTPQHRFRRGGLDFDLGEKAVYWGEQPVKLTRGEYAICEYLALHSGQTFSKEQIYEAVFGFDAPGDQAAVTEHIKNIRAKLRALDCHPIDTVWGVGYRWKRDLP